MQLRPAYANIGSEVLAVSLGFVVFQLAISQEFTCLWSPCSLEPETTLGRHIE